jgi:hypothetical protein
VFRLLYGVGLPEILGWNYARYQHHLAFAKHELTRRQQSDLIKQLGGGGGGES